MPELQSIKKGCEKVTEVCNILNRILTEYPDSWKDEKLFKALLADFLPGDEYILFRNLLRFCVIEKIPEDMKQQKNLNSIKLHFYKKRLVNHYGCSEANALEALTIWKNVIFPENQYHESDDTTEIVHSMSETEKLQRELEELKAQLIQLVAERDELTGVICPELERKFLRIFGELEIRVFEAQCECKRLKRQIELMRANLNRQEPINITEIILKLTIEFEKFQKTIDEEKEKYEEASKKEPVDLDEQDDKKLKKLYRELVKKLHPDINPDQTPEKKELFNQVVEAYQNNDIEKMEILDEIASGNEEAAVFVNDIAQLQQEIAKLRSMIQSVQEEITQIKQQYPYNKKDLLNDEEAIAEKRQNLEEMLDQYNEKIKIYKEKIRVMEEEENGRDTDQ